MMWVELTKWLRPGGYSTSDSTAEYRVYTTEFDLVVDGDQFTTLLGPKGEVALAESDSDLDHMLSRWRAVAEPAAIEAANVYRSKHSADDTTDIVACLLLDHSGSLRGQLAMVATAIAQTIADYWSRIGIRYEILGFTTVSWKGGRSREKWIRLGRPAHPGRLCDLLHIVYRSADDRYSGAPPSIRNLANDKSLKENVDGEAVAWAAGRLRNRREARKILVVVSDGAPVDDSTLSVNDPRILSRHLKNVIASLENTRDIRLAAIGLDYDVSNNYANHLSISCTDEPSTSVVRFVADAMDIPAESRPLPAPSQGRRKITGTKWAISNLFLGLIAALLGLAALMAVLPEYARFMVFPFVLAGWLVSLCLHEFGHAIVAHSCGDLTVPNRGYLTLNPLRYTHLQFSIIWPLVFLAFGGIGLPGGAVYLNTWLLRPAHRAVVSAAGPLATLAVLVLLLATIRVAGSALAGSPTLYGALVFLAFLQLSALVLTLLPIPGLDGWGILEPWLPRNWREFGARVGGIAPSLLFLSFLLVPAMNQIFWRLVFNLCDVTGLSADFAIMGQLLFQFWR